MTKQRDLALSSLSQSLRHGVADQKHMLEMMERERQRKERERIQAELMKQKQMAKIKMNLTGRIKRDVSIYKNNKAMIFEQNR